MGFTRYDLPLRLRPKVVYWTAALNFFKAPMGWPLLPVSSSPWYKCSREGPAKSYGKQNAILPMSFGVLENKNKKSKKWILSQVPNMAYHRSEYAVSSKLNTISNTASIGDTAYHLSEYDVCTT